MIDVYYFDKTVKKADAKRLPRLKGKKIWVDVTDIKKSEADILKKIFELHPVTEEDLLLSHGRVKIENFPGYMFCTFYTVEPAKKKVNLQVLDFIIGMDFVISSHKKPRKNYERLKRENDVLARFFKDGPYKVFHKLLDEEIDEFFPILEGLDEEIESIDEKIALHSDPKLMKEILKMKRKIVEIKKITFPQREKLNFLARRNYKFIPEKARPYFADLYDNGIRVEDVVENFRENVGNTFDAYMTSVANSQNDIMKVLSVIATIALPLTVISGIYGTNFINLPGSKMGDGFWWMMLMMAVFVFFMALYFKKKKWF